MAESPGAVQWAGREVVVTLPEQIDRSDADQVREQLLAVINQGAAVLIVDMSATASCDYSGADALTRAYQRAVANGTQLRFVALAPVVRRVLSLSGLDRLVSTYPTLEAAVAGSTRRQEAPGTGHWADARDQEHRTQELLGRVAGRIFDAALVLQAEPGPPADPERGRIREALDYLDDAIRDIRGHRCAESSYSWRAPRPRGRRAERDAVALAVLRATLLRERAAHAARALQAAAADTAALLDQRANLVGPPTSVDYGTEVKRWQAVADQAEHVVDQLGQR